MKNIFFTIGSLFVTELMLAQEPSIQTPTNKTAPFEEAVPFAVLIFLLLIGYVMLQAVKLFLHHRLKNKIIDKGVSEQLAISILQSSKDDHKKDAVKWVFLLMGIGIGLFIVDHQLPLGLHSAAIMVFSIALAYVGYYVYLKNSKS